MNTERRLQEGQNHLFCNDKISGFRDWFIEVWMSTDTGGVTKSRFSSETDEQKQILQQTDIFCVLQIKWPAAIDIPFSSSKKICLVLKLKGTPLMMDSLSFKGHKKLEGSIVLVEFFFTAMLRQIARSVSNKVSDSEGTLFQRLGTTVTTYNIEFA